MKVVICDGPEDSLASIVEAIEADGELELTDVVRTGTALSKVLRDGRTGLCVIAVELLDIDRVVDRHLGGIARPKKVVAATETPASLIVKAHQYGLDDVIAMNMERQLILRRLKQVANGESNMADHPVLRGLTPRPGVSSPVRLGENDDPDILVLLGLGLSDDEIAMVTGATIQRVRNRIAALIELNKVRTRTHLVVMQATNLHIPDFT